MADDDNPPVLMTNAQLGVTRPFPNRPDVILFWQSQGWVLGDANLPGQPGGSILLTLDLADGRYARIGSGSGGTVGDASSSAKGVLQLAGPLGGTAAQPTVFGLVSTAALVEFIQDTVDALIVAGTGISKTYDDPSGQLVLTATGTGSGGTTPTGFGDSFGTAFGGSS